MSDLISALERLRGARARLDREKAEIFEPMLEGDEFFGLTLRPGDVVRDKVTGGIGHVERVQTHHVVVPAAGREGS